MLTIRPFRYDDADYTALITIDSALFPDTLMSIAEWQHRDATRPANEFFGRDMVERDGVAVAFGEYGQPPSEQDHDRYYFYILVHPERDQPDVRPFYLQHVLNVLAERGSEHKPAALTTGALSDRTTDIAFFKAHGFSEAMREPFSELDVTTFDAAPFAAITERVQATGVRIVSLAELQRTDPNWEQAIYDLHWALMQDVPATLTHTQPSREEFAQHTLNGPTFDVAGWFVALDGDCYVGMSRGWVNISDPAQFVNNLTGVIRDYRRRGIATALKLRLIDYARQQGTQTISTSNEAYNPMFELNAKLGFQPRPAWVSFEKQLQRKKKQ